MSSAAMCCIPGLNSSGDVNIHAQLATVSPVYATDPEDAGRGSMGAETQK